MRYVEEREQKYPGQGNNNYNLTGVYRNKSLNGQHLLVSRRKRQSGSITLAILLYGFLIQPGTEGHVRPSMTRVGNMNTGPNSIEINGYLTINSFLYYLADQIRYDKSG